ncbi:MAG: hypothetical protein ACP5N9_01375 [Candidatus Bilamarchaeum sp.]
MVELTTKELARLIELRRKKTELIHEQKSGLDRAGEINAIEQNALAIENKVKELGVVIVVPNGKKLDELTQKLRGLPPDQIKEAMKIKDGLVYHMLKERSDIIRANYDNRLEVSKLSICSSMIEAEKRVLIHDAIVSGVISTPIDMSKIDQSKVALIVKALNRCGIKCKSAEGVLVPQDTTEYIEKIVDVSGNRIWVSNDLKPKFDENVVLMQQVNVKIQLKNAERQIRQFGEAEEKEFDELQKKYLELIKQKDEILKNYEEESNLSVKI